MIILAIPLALALWAGGAVGIDQAVDVEPGQVAPAQQVQRIQPDPAEAISDRRVSINP